MNLPLHQIVIDEEGFPQFNGIRVSDTSVGLEILSHISVAENGSYITELEGQRYIVESFDDPLVALSFEPEKIEKGTALRAKLYFPYGHTEIVDLSSLFLDEWDRIHSIAKNSVPIVWSRQAQQEFFNCLEDFNDDEFILFGQVIRPKPWYDVFTPSESHNFWNQFYQEKRAGWEMNHAHPILVQMWPKLKVPKSRILVLGAGSAEDAAFFAQQGHIVTAVDFSSQALDLATQKWGQIPQNLKLENQDVFQLPQGWNNQFDYIFEHTFYCAISPSRREELVQIWRRLLAPRGRLMGVFFTNFRNQAPPFGGSEWELKQRLKSHFRFLYWDRIKESPQHRTGKELLVLAEKLT